MALMMVMASIGSVTLTTHSAAMDIAQTSQTDVIAVLATSGTNNAGLCGGCLTAEDGSMICAQSCGAGCSMPLVGLPINIALPGQHLTGRADYGGYRQVLGDWHAAPDPHPPRLPA